MPTDLTTHEQARLLVKNLRDALTYSMALERAAASATAEERAAVRRLLLRAARERERATEPFGRAAAADALACLLP